MSARRWNEFFFFFLFVHLHGSLSVRALSIRRCSRSLHWSSYITRGTRIRLALSTLRTRTVHVSSAYTKESKVSKSLRRHIRFPLHISISYIANVLRELRSLEPFIRTGTIVLFLCPWTRDGMYVSAEDGRYFCQILYYTHWGETFGKNFATNAQSRGRKTFSTGAL